MNLFRKTATRFATKSSKVLSAFTKAIKDLEKINKEIDLESARVQVEINKKQSQLHDMHSTFTANNKMIQKLNSFFE